MAEFSIALAKTLAFEGSYVDDPDDPGGETNLGVTLRVFHLYAHPLLGIEPSSENLKNLTPAQAGILYKANYWHPIRGDELESQELADILFDFYVNAGTHATSLLQQTINSMGVRPALVVDGLVGASTFKALASLPPDQVYQLYKQGRIAYYEKLGQRFPRFVRGWLNRVNAFPDLCSLTQASTPAAQAVEA